MSTKILLAAALAIFLIAGALLYFSSAVFLQLFLALALAYILNPAVTWLETRGIHRIVSVVLVFIATVAGIAGFVSFMAYSISSEFSNVQLNLPAYALHLYEISPPQLKALLGVENPDFLSQKMGNLLMQVKGISPDIIKPLLAALQKAFSSTIGFLLSVLGYFIIPVYLFYLLADFPKLKALMSSFVPERFRPAYTEKLGEVDTILNGFIRGQLMLCAILAVLYSIGLWFIGVDMAIVIGTLAGVTFIIPYVGTILGIVLSMVMALLKFHDILHPLLCLGWFCLVQAIEGSVISPKIVGESVGLHPLVAIVALLIGGQVFGLLGMLLAVPVTAVLQVFVRSLADYYRNSPYYQGVQ